MKAILEMINEYESGVDHSNYPMDIGWNEQTGEGQQTYLSCSGRHFILIHLSIKCEAHRGFSVNLKKKWQRCCLTVKVSFNYSFMAGRNQKIWFYL